MNLQLLVVTLQLANAGPFSAFEPGSVACDGGTTARQLKPNRASKVCEAMFTDFARSYDVEAAVSVAEAQGNLVGGAAVVELTVGRLSRFHRDSMTAACTMMTFDPCEGVERFDAAHTRAAESFQAMLIALERPVVSVDEIQDIADSQAEDGGRQCTVEDCVTRNLTIDGVLTLPLTAAKSWRITTDVAQPHWSSSWSGMACVDPETLAPIVGAGSSEPHSRTELLCAGPAAAELSIGLSHGVFAGNRQSAVEVTVCTEAMVD